MKNNMPPSHDLTAKQRLALSRQALVQTLDEPLWAAVARGFIQRQVQKLDRSAAEDEQRKLKKQSGLAASGRIPS
jgi:hypothetical protein